MNALSHSPSRESHRTPEVGLAVFTLRLGAIDGARPSKEEVACVVGGLASSFSLAPCEGFFRGCPDPGWAVTLAVNDHALIADLAENLRRCFRQDGVGIEAYGRYIRCHSSRRQGELRAELDGIAHGFFPAYFLTAFTVLEDPSRWPDRFAIISAWATTGEDWSNQRNQDADNRLELALKQCGLAHRRVIGASPDGNHAEPGWIVEADLADAVRLGSEFLQDAIYWVDGDLLSVVSCREPRSAPVGRFSERVSIKRGDLIAETTK